MCDSDVDNRQALSTPIYFRMYIVYHNVVFKISLCVLKKKAWGNDGTTTLQGQPHPVEYL